jgi:hypothetical protein
MKRQPRAKTGKGRSSRSLGDRDPRLRGGQPTVSEDTVRARALQRLNTLGSTSTPEDTRDALNEVIDALKGKEN